jgi:hypothetical protein
MVKVIQDKLCFQSLKRWEKEALVSKDKISKKGISQRKKHRIL